jgi:hypothetical protein
MNEEFLCGQRTRGLRLDPGNMALWHRTPFAAAVLFCALFVAVASKAQDRAFLPGPVRVVATAPANGDVNPYGVAFVPPNFPSDGKIQPGDVLVSNFNASSNLQGTGTTIVDVPPNAPLTLFFQGTPPLGLTTALNVLQKGFVLVGNFPSPDGSCAAAGSGSILVIDKNGAMVSTIADAKVQDPGILHYLTRVARQNYSLPMQ